jgi:chorismate mutase/prephenate dehydratase
MSEIEQWRREINDCDRQISQLLHRRAEAAREIGLHKRATGQPFYDASRQKQVLERVVGEAGAGAFPPEGLRSVFAEIMSVCLNMERPTRIGYLGPPGTFSHAAARAEFGSLPELRDFPTIRDIFSAVDKGWVDYGVVPVENSAGGMVHDTLDMFLESSALICGEILLRVSHFLLSKGKREGLKRVYSHPQGFAQCRLWLRQNLPKVDLVETASTAQGVERALEDPESAAIASALAARIHSIDILEANIEDKRDNHTRFLVLGTHPGKPAPNARTSMMFGLPDRPGALYHILGLFSEAKINLTKIESRPSRLKAWDYVFFADLEGHADDPAIAGAIAHLKETCPFFKLLGSYALAKAPGEVSVSAR